MEGGETFLVNCGQTTDATRWHKLILGLKARWTDKNVLKTVSRDQRLKGSNNLLVNITD